MEAEAQKTGKTVPVPKKAEQTTDVQGERMNDITNGASSLCIDRKATEPSPVTAGVVAALPKVKFTYVHEQSVVHYTRVSP